MPRILFKYTLKEIFPATILSLAALTFIIFMTVRVPGRDEHLPLMLMRLMMRPDVAKSDVIMTFLLTLPTTIAFILPMAYLIGVIIGIGRLTLDFEVRAIQTGGINLFMVFSPILVLAGLLSLATGIFTYAPEPRLFRDSVKRVGRLLVSEFETLEPGRVYNQVFASQSGLNLYFDKRAPGTDRMNGVTLMIDKKSVESEEKHKERKQSKSERIAALRDQLSKGEINKEEFDKMEYESRLKEKTVNPIMIFAGEAEFSADPDEGRVDLNLYKGSIHMADPSAGDSSKPNAKAKSQATAQKSALPPEMEGEGATKPKGEGDYALVKFGKFSKTEMITGEDLRKNRRTQTVPELIQTYQNPNEKKILRLRARGAILERYSSAFENLILAFIGLPLAVRVRPTGKSVGILLAFMLILAYHWLIRTGFSLIESENKFGPLVIFSPNLLFAAVGTGLWWNVIRK